MDKKEFKAIVFDAYGTLFDINSLDTLLTNNFGSRAQELSSIWRRKQLEYTWLRTLMQRYKPFSEITMDALLYGCTYLGLEMSKELEERLKRKYLKLQAFQEVREVMMELKDRVRLGILSNADPEMLSGAISHNQLDGIFSHVLSAHSVKIFKPSKEVYQLACQAFNCQSREILFVSSNTWDVSGAKSHGLQVAWLRRGEGIMEKLDVGVVMELQNLRQLIHS